LSHSPSLKGEKTLRAQKGGKKDKRGGNARHLLVEAAREGENRACAAEKKKKKGVRPCVLATRWREAEKGKSAMRQEKKKKRKRRLAPTAHARDLVGVKRKKKKNRGRIAPLKKGKKKKNKVEDRSAFPGKGKRGLALFRKEKTEKCGLFSARNRGSHATKTEKKDSDRSALLAKGKVGALCYQGEEGGRKKSGLDLPAYRGCPKIERGSSCSGKKEKRGFLYAAISLLRDTSGRKKGG